MPTYEYQCPKCKATYELRQGFDAETTHTCMECGKGTAKRVLHAPRIHFKGSGFYVTDSKGHNPAGEDAKPGEPATPEPAKTEARKPEKAEAKKPASTSAGEAAAS